MKNIQSTRKKYKETMNFPDYNFTSQIKVLVRPEILNMTAYSSARSLAGKSVTNKSNGKSSDKNYKMLLDANEYPISSLVNRYPDKEIANLKQLLSTFYNCNNKQVIIGNGSDEILDLIIRAFCRPYTDSIIVLSPGYGMYQTLANINGISTIAIPLNDQFNLGQEELEAIISLNHKAEQASKLLIICSPNNPTGNDISPEKILKILEKFKGIVVIDEAYIEFSEAPSWTARINEYPNLFVLRTLSKCVGMAGLRIGCGISSEEIIEVLQKIKPPYNVSSLNANYALRRFDDNKIKIKANTIRKTRNLFVSKLSDCPGVIAIYPSQSNFVLVKFKQRTKLFNYLRNQNITVRDRSQEQNCNNCLRITIGTAKEMQLLYNAIINFYKSSKNNA